MRSAERAVARAREVEDLQAGDAFGVAAARIVSVRAHELFDPAPAALDIADIEPVHAMRVATRRLRAVLEIFERAFPQEGLRPVLTDVEQLADALATRRDPDVQIEQFTALRDELGPDEQAGLELLLSRLRDEQAEGNVALAAALAAVQADDLPGRLQALCAQAEART
jgi:CHAD domain-containing protein